MITWKQWVKNAAGSESIRQIASKISVSPSSVSKWFRTGRPPADAVVAVARAYRADIVVGLVCAGIMTVDDVQRDVENRLKFVPTYLLLNELHARGNRGTDDLAHGLAPEWEDNDRVRHEASQR
ncbi:hypothetical protein ACF044_10905 [Microbacterium sp. NPDC016588]